MRDLTAEEIAAIDLRCTHMPYGETYVVVPLTDVQRLAKMAAKYLRAQALTKQHVEAVSEIDRHYMNYPSFQKPPPGFRERADALVRTRDSTLTELLALLTESDT